MKKKSLYVLLVMLLCVPTIIAQGKKALYINEVMVQNDSNYVDDYGMRHGWIELYNAAYAPTEISSVYITDDKNFPKKYPVPRGDEKTEIGARQHVLFFADNEPNKGTFHLNFTLKPGQENWIGIYAADGITLIDEVTIPADLKGNFSYARKVDGGDEWSVRDGGETHYITPSSANMIVSENLKIQNFKTHDSHGFVMALLAMSIVFSALLLLSLLFILLGKISIAIAHRNELKSKGLEEEVDILKPQPQAEGEVYAAIAMALEQHLNQHDNEDTILTINRVKKAYSPWSSKIYTLREIPNRRN